MEGFMDRQLICRACLRIVENKYQSFGFIEDVNGNLKDMIMCCVPEMDIYVSSQPIMCFPCIQLLITVYNFKTRCLNTETIIRSYIQRNSLMEYNHVNLSCVVEELLRLNSLFHGIESRKQARAEMPSLLVRNQPNSGGNQCCIPNNQPDMLANQFHGRGENFNVNHNTEGVGNHPAGGGNQPEVLRHRPEVPPSQLLTQHQLMSQNQLDRQRQNPFATHNQLHAQNQLAIRNQLVTQHQRATQPHLASQNQLVTQHQLATQPQLASQHQLTTQPQLATQNQLAVQNQVELPRNPHMQLVAQPAPMENILTQNQPATQPHLASQNQLEFPGNSRIPLITQPTAMENSHAQNYIANRSPLVPQVQEPIVAQEPQYRIVEREEESETKDNNSTDGDGQIEPVQKRIRLVIKIDKAKISIPFDKNEDSNEKENEEQREVAADNVLPPPENGLSSYQLQDTGQEIYQCDSCTFVTTHLSYHMAHKKICCNELEKFDKKCPHCPHVTNRTYALNKHINTMHTRSVWYYCDLCPYRSTDPSCLRRHKRNVHPDFPKEELICHLCSHPFSTEYHLKKHLLKHEENAMLQCEFCSYSTKDRSNFRKHIFTHNPNAEQCEFCDYKSVSPYQMKLHLKKMHHGVGMEDIDCRTEVSISEVVHDISAAINASTGLVGHETK